MIESCRARASAIVVLGSLMAAVSSPAAEGGFSAALDGRYTAAWPSGSIEITQGGRAGSASKIDLSRDLDLGVGQTGGGGGRLGFGPHGLAFFYEPLFFDGDTVLGRDVTFHGSTYAAGTRVSSHVGFDLWRVGYDYALATAPTESLSVGLRLLVWDFDARLRGGTIDQQRSFSSALPQAVVSGSVELGRVRLAADFAGGLIASDRYSFEIGAGPRWQPLSWLEVGVGYRVFRLEFHQTTNRGDLTAHGPFVGVSIPLGPIAKAH